MSLLLQLYVIFPADGLPREGRSQGPSLAVTPPPHSRAWILIILETQEIVVEEIPWGEGYFLAGETSSTVTAASVAAPVGGWEYAGAGRGGRTGGQQRFHKKAT